MVMSVDVLNNGPGGLVVVVPITTAGYGLRSHVELEPEAGGLDHTSYARCDQLRVVSVERLSSRQGNDRLRSEAGHRPSPALRPRSVMPRSAGQYGELYRKSAIFGPVAFLPARMGRSGYDAGADAPRSTSEHIPNSLVA
ncbi:type II toxin-antitoxin system PemK/MazF family toxin [Mycolicibacter acidiphilus]|uniref:type II toxin-antitoxin system PemK/MazF family toxin n=1 Tax=Mycolicibacter acidiphilus TaxID=2835306 RepID=UPI0027DBBF87|nr:type II toxin-antitoxin system PemK/MazF family toxin [Mycolicibacter acidiphilus]